MGIKTFVYVEGAGRGNWELQSLLVKNMKPVTLNYSKSNHCDSSSVVVPPPHPGEQVWAKSNLNEGFLDCGEGSVSASSLGGVTDNV